MKGKPPDPPTMPKQGNSCSTFSVLGRRRRIATVSDVFMIMMHCNERVCSSVCFIVYADTNHFFVERSNSLAIQLQTDDIGHTIVNNETITSRRLHHHVPSSSSSSTLRSRLADVEQQDVPSSPSARLRHVDVEQQDVADPQGFEVVGLGRVYAYYH